MSASPSSGLSAEAKEFVPLGQNPAISIPLYVDENTVASIYPSDQHPLMVQAIYPMMVTSSKVTDNLHFPEIEFHIQSSHQQQFHIDACTNVPQSSAINGSSPSSSTSQIVLLPASSSAAAATPTGYYPGPPIIYSTNEPIAAFYPIDYCEPPLINFSLQHPPQMGKSHRMLSPQQRPSSYRQPHGMSHSSYRPSSRGGTRGNPNSRSSYYDYGNRRNGSAYLGRGSSSNSKRVSSSHHPSDYSNYYHSSQPSRSRGYASRSAQHTHDEHRKDYLDYYNHDGEYHPMGHVDDDGTPFEFRPEDFPSLPMNNQQSDNKTASPPTACATVKYVDRRRCVGFDALSSRDCRAASSWNEIVSAQRHRSTSPPAVPASQDQRSDRSRSFNNKSATHDEHKVSSKRHYAPPGTSSKSPTRASKAATQDEHQHRSLSLTPNDLPVSEPAAPTNDSTDDGFIQTKHQHRRLKRRNKLREDPSSFTEPANDAESAPYALDDETAFPILGQLNSTSTTAPDSEVIAKSSSKPSHLDLPKMFDSLSTSTPKREQPRARKSAKTKRSITRDTEENQKPSPQSTVTKPSEETTTEHETDTNAANAVEP